MVALPSRTNPRMTATRLASPVFAPTNIRNVIATIWEKLDSWASPA